MVEKNSRKSLLNTLDKLPFWLKIFALNLVEKTLLMKWEKLAQSPLEILEKNNAQTPKFIGLEKLAVGIQVACRSTVRSTGQRSYFSPLCHRSTGRSTEARIQRASLSVRSTTRSTGAFSESRALWTVDRSGRPALLPKLACTSVHVGRPGRSTGWSQYRISGIKNLVFWLT